MSTFEVYSDGGADSSGQGGAACIVRGARGSKCIVAHLQDATNNEGEILAALIGLACARTLQANAHVLWYSDSEYSLKSASQYIFNWQRNGWKTAAKKPVKNQGLWKTFLKLRTGLELEYEHVRGHSGHPENEACDSAVGYVRAQGSGAKPAFQCIAPDPYANWLVFNGTPLLRLIREREEDGLSAEEFTSALPMESLA